MIREVSHVWVCSVYLRPVYEFPVKNGLLSYSYIDVYFSVIQDINRTFRRG